MKIIIILIITILSFNAYASDNCINCNSGVSKYYRPYCSNICKINYGYNRRHSNRYGRSGRDYRYSRDHAEYGHEKVYEYISEGHYRIRYRHDFNRERNENRRHDCK